MKIMMVLVIWRHPLAYVIYVTLVGRGDYAGYSLVGSAI